MSAEIKLLFNIINTLNVLKLFCLRPISATMIVLSLVIIKNLKTLKISYIFEKTVLSIICSKCENDNEKIFK